MLIEEKVLMIVAYELAVEVDQIKFDSQLVKDLGADSLDLLSLSARLALEFNIKMPDHWPADSRVLDIVTYVYRSSIKDC